MSDLVDTGDIELQINENIGTKDNLVGAASDTDEEPENNDPRNCMLPDGKQIQLGLKYLDLTITLEKILFDMNSLFFWVSCAEIALFMFSIICALDVLMNHMTIVVMFIPHAIRGCVGIHLSKQFPKSHEILRDISYNIDERRLLSFDSIVNQLTENSEKVFFELYTKNKKFTGSYACATYFSKIFDFIIFIRILVKYGHPGEEDSEMMLLFIWLAFVILSFQYMTFAYLNYYRLPEEVANKFISMMSTIGDQAGHDAARLQENPKYYATRTIIENVAPRTMRYP